MKSFKNSKLRLLVLLLIGGLIFAACGSETTEPVVEEVPAEEVAEEATSEEEIEEDAGVEFPHPQPDEQKQNDNKPDRFQRIGRSETVDHKSGS